MTTATLDAGIMDFTEERREIRFRVGEDVFDCLPDLPVLALIDFATQQDKIAEAEISPEMKQMFIDLFRIVLTEESAGRFIARMEDRANPIGMKVLNRLMPWIMEQYGMRPTEPSGSSSPGQLTPGSGQNSTVNQPPAASTSVAYPSLVS